MRGRPSNRGKPKRFRQKVLRLVAAKYSGPEDKRFGPTLAAEHLASEDGLEVDAETLRRWMLGEGLWSRQRKRKAHRNRRERKKHFGELVQLHGIIAASSPQAKGRVERGNGTHQDRLIKKMRRKKIASFEGANEYMEEEYLPEQYRRFAVAPASPADFHLLDFPGHTEIASSTECRRRSRAAQKAAFAFSVLPFPVLPFKDCTTGERLLDFRRARTRTG